MMELTEYAPKLNDGFKETSTNPTMSKEQWALAEALLGDFFELMESPAKDFEKMANQPGFGTTGVSK
jgi:hypothetical protein